MMQVVLAGSSIRAALYEDLDEVLARFMHVCLPITCDLFNSAMLISDNC